MGKGLLIAFEGIDGAGKFTQLKKTEHWLEDGKYPVHWSSEPNDRSSPIGMTIRAMLQRKRDKPDDPVEFQRMYVIDRAQDIFVHIKEHLERDGIYLIERYAFSTMAYGMLSGEPLERFLELHREVIGKSMIWPHRTILLDISGRAGMSRIEEKLNARRSGDGPLPIFTREPEYFERIDWLEKIRQNYLKIARLPEFIHKTAVINAERDEEEVFADIKKAIEVILPTSK